MTETFTASDGSQIIDGEFVSPVGNVMFFMGEKVQAALAEYFRAKDGCPTCRLSRQSADGASGAQ